MPNVNVELLKDELLVAVNLYQTKLRKLLQMPSLFEELKEIMLANGILNCELAEHMSSVNYDMEDFLEHPSYSPNTEDKLIERLERVKTVSKRIDELMAAAKDKIIGWLDLSCSRLWEKGQTIADPVLKNDLKAFLDHMSEMRTDLLLLRNPAKLIVLIKSEEFFKGFASIKDRLSPIPPVPKKRQSRRAVISTENNTIQYSSADTTASAMQIPVLPSANAVPKIKKPVPTPRRSKRI